VGRGDINENTLLLSALSSFGTRRGRRLIRSAGSGQMLFMES
jgi:hypothetical protein